MTNLLKQIIKAIEKVRENYSANYHYLIIKLLGIFFSYFMIIFQLVQFQKNSIW